MERAAAENRADEELKGVRDEFIQRLSAAVMNQLLDLCLKDRVFDYDERDEILEENRTRAGKARAFIDAVIKKGPETCKKMIGYLERKDKELFKLLGLSSQSAADKRKKEEEGGETAGKQARQEDKPDGVTQSQDLSEKQLLQVAKQLGMEWKEVAIYLGLESKDLDDLEEAEKSVNMRKHKMLLKWKRKTKPGEATAKHLLKSLEEMNNLPVKVYEILKGMVADVRDEAAK
ncbi:caspase-1-like isoform X2 [Poeciliopsis prolifica]|uniref:caspase-1-like isoform X2 n=1 Tax=Poeciliopsis prolifica TaxID=188132 RepID=UPI002413C259|nr:caspase-1-like isoform X2 [Poeciliopsis prolifica]